jgi:hypothetical protein
MKKLIKKILKLKYLNLIYTYVYHAIQRRRYYGIINKYDAECPLMGKLRERGYRVMAIAQDNLHQLQNFRKDQVIYLEKKHAQSLNEILNLFIEDVDDYLGVDVRIDVICVTEINELMKENVSQNWHTDNVGNRLKLFICIDGDGSYPTFYVPRSNLTKYYPSLREDLRMIGKKNIKNLNGEDKLSHITGMATIFDTNGLHRGGYEVKGKLNKRRIIEIEFSNKNKSNLLMGNAAIGPRHYDGKFEFDDEFIAEFKHKKYLDDNLIKKINSKRFKYG